MRINHRRRHRHGAGRHHNERRCQEATRSWWPLFLGSEYLKSLSSARPVLVTCNIRPAGSFGLPRCWSSTRPAVRQPSQKLGETIRRDQAGAVVGW